MSRPLGQEIPCGMRQCGKSDKKKRCQWQDPPPGDTKSVSTFPSGIFALGCGPPGPLWRSDQWVTGALATSFHRITPV